MARNKFVGIGGLDVGLKLIPIGERTQYAEIPVNEFGLQEVTFRFATFDPGQFRPERGTKCPDFIAADAKTTEILALFPYLACQTSKIIARGNGVHIVDVTCQGAVFGSSDPSPVERVDVTDGGQYTSEPVIVFTGGDEVTPASAEPQMEYKTIAIHDGGSGYIPGNLVDLDLGEFNYFPFVPPHFGEPRLIRFVVQTVGGGGVITSVAVIRQDPLPRILNNPVPVKSPGTGSFDFTWKMTGVNILDGGSYLGTPAADADGGLYTTRAVLGAVHMGGFARFGAITKPVTPVSTVKDTVEIPIFSDPANTILVSKVTIDYRAIELSFEYMAEHFVDQPRFIGDEYQLVDGQKILIDPTGGATMLLRIAAVSAIAQVTDANGTVSDGEPIAIDEATWRAAIRYVGDAAQFQQVQAGAMWHVTETVTIRIFPRLSPLPPGPPPPPPYHGPWWL